MVVEEIELEQLHALVFKIQQCAIDAAGVGAEDIKPAHDAGKSALFIARGPVLRPIEPRCFAPRHGCFTATAARGVFRYFAEKSRRSVDRNVTKSAQRIGDTTPESRLSNFRINSEENYDNQQAEYDVLVHDRIVSMRESTAISQFNSGFGLFTVQANCSAAAISV